MAWFGIEGSGTAGVGQRWQPGIGSASPVELRLGAARSASAAPDRSFLLSVGRSRRGSDAAGGIGSFRFGPQRTEVTTGSGSAAVDGKGWGRNGTAAAVGMGLVRSGDDGVCRRGLAAVGWQGKVRQGGGRDRLYWDRSESEGAVCVGSIGPSELGSAGLGWPVAALGRKVTAAQGVCAAASAADRTGRDRQGRRGQHRQGRSRQRASRLDEAARGRPGPGRLGQLWIRRAWNAVAATDCQWQGLVYDAKALYASARLGLSATGSVGKAGDTCATAWLDRLAAAEGMRWGRYGWASTGVDRTGETGTSRRGTEWQQWSGGFTLGVGASRVEGLGKAAVAWTGQRPARLGFARHGSIGQRSAGLGASGSRWLGARVDRQLGMGVCWVRLGAGTECHGRGRARRGSDGRSRKRVVRMGLACSGLGLAALRWQGGDARGSARHGVRRQRRTGTDWTGGTGTARTGTAARGRVGTAWLGLGTGCRGSIGLGGCGIEVEGTGGSVRKARVGSVGSDRERLGQARQVRVGRAASVRQGMRRMARDRQ